MLVGNSNFEMICTQINYTICDFLDCLSVIWGEFDYVVMKYASFSTSSSSPFEAACTLHEELFI